MEYAGRALGECRTTLSKFCKFEPKRNESVAIAKGFRIEKNGEGNRKARK